MDNKIINSSASSIEDTVNKLMLYGASRGVLLGEILRIARYLLGNPGTLIIDEDGTGEVSGVVLGNAAIIEHVAEICVEHGWETTDLGATDTDVELQ